jgi:hypothetical protein
MAATITKNQFGTRKFGDTILGFGNLTAFHYKLVTLSTGAVAESDSTAVVAVGDTVRIGLIPGGVTLFDLLVIISDAWTGSVTGKIGFAYADGEDSTAVPQDDDYFVAAGQSLASVAIVRKTATTAPVKLPKDAWLTLTTAGAATNAASITDFVVYGEQGGTN